MWVLFVPDRVNGKGGKLNGEKDCFDHGHPSDGYPARWLGFAVFPIQCLLYLQLCSIRQQDCPRFYMQIGILLSWDAFSDERHFADGWSSAWDRYDISHFYVLSDCEVHVLALFGGCRRERVE
jgi:hypothetical protein